MKKKKSKVSNKKKAQANENLKAQKTKKPSGGSSLFSRKPKFEKEPDSVPTPSEKTGSQAQTKTVETKSNIADLHPRKEWIRCENTVLQQIEEHAYSITDAEVGGMLFGEVTENQTNVIGFVPARKAAVDQISLTFTHEVWEDILSEGAKKFPNTNIVGWYHTHPSFGLFLSEYDSFIQRNFFSASGQIALVIDPISGQRGWFHLGLNDSIEPLGVEETIQGPLRTSEQHIVEIAKSQEPKISWKIKAAIVAGVLASAFAGYGYALSNSPVDLRSQYYELNSVVQRIQLGDLTLAYQIQKGDTLQKIAKIFYGDAKYKDRLLTANPDLKGKKLVAGEFVYVYQPTRVELDMNFVLPQQPDPTPEETPSESSKPSPSVSETPKTSPTPTIPNIKP